MSHFRVNPPSRVPQHPTDSLNALKETQCLRIPSDRSKESEATSSAGLQPTSDGLQPTSDGDGLQPTSFLLLVERNFDEPCRFFGAF